MLLFMTHPPPPPKSLPRLHIRLERARTAVGVTITTGACLAPRADRPEARLTGTNARVAANIIRWPDDAGRG